ncbi:MAG: hypothetical protein ABH813_01815 [Patescibacteria group bacterium]
MQYLFAFVAFVAIFANYILINPSGSAQNAQNAPSSPKIEKAVSGISTISVINATTRITKTQESQKLAPGFLIDTFITSGPKDGQAISTTSKIVFKFNGITTPAQEGKISYETKIIGLDSKWQSVNSNERTVEFPAGNRGYTFLVRSKVGGFYDLTPAETTFSVKNSPDLGKIKISGVYINSIILSPNLASGQSIDITGWKIAGKDNTFVIPLGIEMYLGTSVSFGDIFAEQGEQIYIQGTSTPPYPLNKAFKPNKCFGYLPAFSRGNPLFSYSKICPSIDRNDICDFNKTCQNVILQLRNCNLPGTSQLFAIKDDQDCQNYVNNYIYKNLNYSGCLANYSKDQNFLTNRWYIFSGFDISCKSGKNIIYLFDKDGLLVDKYDSGCVY